MLDPVSRRTQAIVAAPGHKESASEIATYSHSNHASRLLNIRIFNLRIFNKKIQRKTTYDRNSCVVNGLDDVF